MVEGMPDLLLVLWSLVIFVFALVELVNLKGNFFSFALGGLGGIAAWALGLDLAAQAGAFIVVSAISFLLLRPLFKRKAEKNTTRHTEGLDLLVGLEGKVIAKVDGPAGTGRVEIGGRPVKAVPVDPQQKYNVGDHIVAVRLEDDTMVVKKAKKRG